MDQGTDRLARMGRIEVNGHSAAASGRLDYVMSLVNSRLQQLREERDAGAMLPPSWRGEPAFEVHVVGGLEEIIDNREMRSVLRQVAAFGEETRVVVFLHGTADEVAVALAPSGTMLGAALVANRSIRLASPTGAGR